MKARYHGQSCGPPLIMAIGLSDQRTQSGKLSRPAAHARTPVQRQATSRRLTRAGSSVPPESPVRRKVAQMNQAQRLYREATLLRSATMPRQWLETGPVYIRPWEPRVPYRLHCRRLELPPITIRVRTLIGSLPTSVRVHSSRYCLVACYRFAGRLH